MRIVTVQDGAQLFSGAVEQMGARFIKTKDRCSACIGAETDDAQVCRSGEQGV